MSAFDPKRTRVPFVGANDRFDGINRGDPRTAAPDRLAKNIPNLDLLHPWHPGAEQAITLARDCEVAARTFDKRITNSEGASVSTHEGVEIYANTNGFVGHSAGSV